MERLGLNVLFRKRDGCRALSTVMTLRVSYQHGVSCYLNHRQLQKEDYAAWDDVIGSALITDIIQFEVKL